jgi:short-subunit dehydrogenase
MNKLQDRVVVITGASSGIGRATALKYAREGANLVLAARRKQVLKEVAEECERHGSDVIVVETDVSNESEVENLAKKALSEFGHIDIWINNAGVGVVGRFDEVPIEEHRQVIETDLMGTIHGAYAAISQFRRQGFGTLINVSSYLGKGSSPYHTSYTAAKHGVRGFGMSLRQELWANNEKEIRVCTVMPVSIDTPFFQHAANHTGKPVIPIPPVYDVDEAANALLSLAFKPQDEVIVGRAGKLFSLQGRIAPRLTEKQMAWHTHRAAMKQDKSARDSSGNLFKSMKAGTGTRGGWLDRNTAQELPGEHSGGAARKVGGGIALLAVPAILGWLLYSRRRDEISDWRAEAA